MGSTGEAQKATILILNVMGTREQVEAKFAKFIWISSFNFWVSVLWSFLQ